MCTFILSVLQKGSSLFIFLPRYVIQFSSKYCDIIVLRFVYDSILYLLTGTNGTITEIEYKLNDLYIPKVFRSTLSTNIKIKQKHIETKQHKIIFRNKITNDTLYNDFYIQNRSIIAPSRKLHTTSS
jgi:hypothetical protein